MSCFNVGDHNILLCERSSEVDKAHVEERNVHHSFTVAPETLAQACKIFKEKKVPIDRLYYRGRGYFTGRELYFFDPSGNRLELRDPTWKAGMPEPTFDEVARSIVGDFGSNRSKQFQGSNSDKTSLSLASSDPNRYGWNDWNVWNHPIAPAVCHWRFC